MSDDLTVNDFRKGDIVQHIFLGRSGYIVTVGRKYLHVKVTLGPDKPIRWLPTSVRAIGHVGGDND